MNAVFASLGKTPSLPPVSVLMSDWMREWISGWFLNRNVPNVSGKVQYWHHLQHHLKKSIRSVRICDQCLFHQGAPCLPTPLSLWLSLHLFSLYRRCVCEVRLVQTLQQKSIALIKKRHHFTERRKKKKSCFRGVVWEASQSAIYKAHGCHICTLAHRKRGEKTAHQPKEQNSATIEQVHRHHLVHNLFCFFFFFLFLAIFSHQDVWEVGSGTHFYIQVQDMNKYCAVL